MSFRIRVDVFVRMPGCTKWSMWRKTETVVWKMKQSDKTVPQYETRLLDASEGCEYIDVDNQIRDQVVENCKSDHLRRKFLEKGDELSLKSMLKEHEEVIPVSLGGVDIGITVDSGSDSNIIDGDLWNYLKSKNIKYVSQKGGKKFPYASRTPLKTLDTFSTVIAARDHRTEATFTVIDGTAEPLLSKETAMKLGNLKIALNINSVRSSPAIPECLNKYPEVFLGLGKLENGQVKLKIETNVKPIAQPMRRVPFGLRGKVEAKVKELIEKDIIEPVEEPTPWVNPIVIVPNASGDIRLCLDMRRASEAILRERQPTPTTDEVSQNMSENQGTDITKDKVEAVVSARQPDNANEVRSFLGLVNISSRFIPDYATLAEPFRQPTRKNQPFVFGKDQVESLESLKAALGNSETLGYYNLTAKTRVIAGTSPVGRRAVLAQEQTDTSWRIISYASRSLSDVERRYSQTEKEALAIV
ncbi:uncharacterized protein [Haliotis asinina]|uniref:uncharacterized protein n=1 Tax=Haliotis asinina TaxID=109174 RepID=UPI003531E0A8